MDLSELKKKVWFIETAPKDEKDVKHHPTTGGGVCIDPTGLILTASHVLAVKDLDRKSCIIRAKLSLDDTLFDREVELIEDYPWFDLALFRVSQTTENEVFEFVEIADAVQVMTDERVFGYVHQNDLLFTKTLGVVTYPFLDRVNLPDVTDKTTMLSSGFLNNNPTFLEDQEYRTVASAVEKIDTSLHDLNPGLPLVQVSGYGRTPGASGCPLFKCDTGEFIGIFTFLKYCHHFVIPVNFLKVFVDHVRKVKGC